jgi:hypothetical protein
MNIKDLVKQYTDGLISELELVHTMQVSPKLLARIQTALSLPYNASHKIYVVDLISDDPRDAPVSGGKPKRYDLVREDNFD